MGRIVAHLTVVALILHLAWTVNPTGITDHGFVGGAVAYAAASAAAHLIARLSSGPRAQP